MNDLRMFAVTVAFAPVVTRGWDGGWNTLVQHLAAYNRQHAAVRAMRPFNVPGKMFGIAINIVEENPQPSDAERDQAYVKLRALQVRMEIKIQEAVHCFELETGAHVRELSPYRDGMGLVDMIRSEIA